jgi:hypothetical protein
MFGISVMALLCYRPRGWGRAVVGGVFRQQALCYRRCSGSRCWGNRETWWHTIAARSGRMASAGGHAVLGTAGSFHRMPTKASPYHHSQPPDMMV